MENQQNNNTGGYLFLMIGIIIAAVIIAWGFGNILDNSETISVKGYAEKTIKSDYAVWSITINARTPTLAETYSVLNRNKLKIKEYLQNNGFENDIISESSLNNFTLYDYSNSGDQVGVKGYQMSQNLSVTSKDLDKIRRLSLSINSLLSEGIDFISNPPEYYISDIGKYKIEMLGEALRDAQARAQAIAGSVGNKVGGIKSARQGIFQITAANSTEISDWGINDVSSIEKSIKSVVDATFFIK